jgi:hypothetical protein
MNVSRFLWMPALLFTVVACGGPPASRGPLYLATADAGGGTGSVNVQVVDNTVTINGRLESGCRPVSGDYVVDGRNIEVRLASPGSTCSESGSGAFTTRVGPLSPGGYRVTVRVGDQTVVASQEIRIG